MDEKLKLAEAELQLAAENLAAAVLVEGGGFHRNAVANLYCGAYHAVVALLAIHGIEAATHDGVQTMFGLHFVKPGEVDKNAGKFLGHLRHAGLTADYKAYLDLDRSDCDDAATQARLVVGEVARYLRQHMPQLPLTSIDAALAKL